MTAAPELEIDRLSLRFGGLHILDDVSLWARKGEVLALVGPNGAGKTSVLNCISGIYAGSGEIRLLGQQLTGRAAHKVARLGVARTFQHAELFPDMTVAQNILVGTHTNSAGIDDVVAFTGLGPLLKHRAADLSFGQQKAVGFARALALRPRLLLLDEPAAGLNGQERNELALMIDKARRQLDVPIVWIEHDMQMVSELADRIHVLSSGRTLAVGSVRETLTNPAVVAAYLGTA